jgi:iron complex outermembrane receptor protein
VKKGDISMKPLTSKKLVKSAITLAIVNACLSQSVYATETAKDDDSGRIEKIIVTANRHAQDLQEVSSSITVLGRVMLNAQALLMPQAYNKSFQF